VKSIDVSEAVLSINPSAISELRDEITAAKSAADEAQKKPRKAEGVVSKAGETVPPVGVP
jgi:hypothetical protein